MIYGLNFNGTEIPPAIRRRFADSLDSRFRAVGSDRGCTWRLAGVAEYPHELEQMLIQANNGHRRLHVVPRRIARYDIPHTAPGHVMTHYAVYVG